MRIGMTMMVRDEADIIGTSIDHALASGIDRIIVTDNGSVDGTTEILEDFAAQGALELLHEPEHRKQQSSTVSLMARELALGGSVDWVINADADEFLIAGAGRSTLHEAFASIPHSIEAFQVPVVNMVGPLMMTGWDPREMRWRDERSAPQLRAVGLLSHPTPNAIHVARTDVTVAQGNHSVSIAGSKLPARVRFEVLHFPWRSWEQYARRVEASGRAYLANTEMTPSPNHHGMLDYSRLRRDLLLSYFAARHPLREELHGADGFIEDLKVAELVAGQRKHNAVGLSDDLRRGLGAAGRRLVSDEDSARQAASSMEETLRVHAMEIAAAHRHLGELAKEIAVTREELHRLRNGRGFRFVQKASALLHR